MTPGQAPRRRGRCSILCRVGAGRSARPPSLHLALCVTRSTGHDLVRWVAGHLLSADVVRQDLPRFGTAEEQSSHVAALREEVLARLTRAGMQVLRRP